MEILRVNGGRRLSGEAQLTAAKNAVLPIMAAALMAGAPVTLLNVPEMGDIDNMSRILEALGCRVERRGRELYIDARAAREGSLNGELSRRLRSSIFMLGPLLGRFRRAEAAYPGGCAIGKRPIDMHLSGLAALGARVSEANGLVQIDGGGMHAGDVRLPFPSVGATENVMMAAVLLPGESRIFNAAREPEIVDLAGFLNALGARVRGAGTEQISIDGVKRLDGAEYRPIPDRIVAGTLLAAAAITGGSVALPGARAEHMEAVLQALSRMGVSVRRTAAGVEAAAALPLRPIRVTTGPFPGFPTDMQAPLLALACRARGESCVTETLFENRFQHVEPLRAMGAQIRLEQRTACVTGGTLRGCPVVARDLRCGAALVVAALGASGQTDVGGVELIDRGYERLEDQLAALGADIRRLAVPAQLEPVRQAR
ncbi:MAG: UDP-N-acetylglucosamine 1-carboxyvinyltransferase [Clostridia bacterium]|nr:UDP-N-acetylglucosamine 1-carboxyvinyltransferase [Clostridia bacterium]